MLKRMASHQALMFGLVMIAAIVLAAIFADWISPFDPLRADPRRRYLPPLSGPFLLGTDELGRDILSRLIFGARYALLVAIVPTVIALVIGGAVGLLSGYVRGWIDAVVMRVFDVMLAFPGVLLALAIGAALGPGLNSMVIAMVVVTIPAFGRVVRGIVLSLREELYVEAGRILGYSHIRIASRHILPNLFGSAIVFGTLQTGRNVILSASLSFLGLGLQPPIPEWGQMLSSGRTALATAAHVSTIPGLAIVLLAISFNMIGDGVRDIFDPRYNSDRV